MLNHFYLMENKFVKMFGAYCIFRCMYKTIETHSTYIYFKSR